MRAETESILRKKRRFEIEKCGGNRKSEKMRKSEKHKIDKATSAQK